jgi:hypothetical protein
MVLWPCGSATCCNSELQECSAVVKVLVLAIVGLQNELCVASRGRSELSACNNDGANLL